jgi:hypothetical protein
VLILSFILNFPLILYSKNTFQVLDYYKHTPRVDVEIVDDIE